MDETLLNKYIRGEYLTDEERTQVIEWLEESSENMERYRSLHKMYDAFIWNSAYREEAAETKELKPERSRVKRYLFAFGRYAAVFIIAILSGYIFFKNYDKSHMEAVVNNSIYVPAGQRAEVTLGDGTKVWLNAKTKLIYPEKFSAASRDVYLDGEAYFDVEKDEKRPFVVKTEKYDIKVLGTEFNVMAYEGSGSFHTSLIEGSVEIQSPEKKSLCVLQPNNMAYLTNDALKTMPISDYNFLLWKEGIIYFDNETVQDIMKKLELYFDIKINVNNESLLKYQYSGKFRTKDGVEQVLKVLQLKHKFQYTRDDTTNTITII